MLALANCITSLDMQTEDNMTHFTVQNSITSVNFNTVVTY